MELKKKANQESALAEFFKNPLQPFDNPIIKENTDRYKERDKLNNTALLQVLGKLGKKQDQKMVTMMEIRQVYFYTIPLITVEIKKEMRFLTSSTPLKRENRFEKHWTIPTPKQKEFLTVHKIKLPKALWVDCDRCNTENIADDTQEAESCLCGDTGLVSITYIYKTASGFESLRLIAISAQEVVASKISNRSTGQRLTLYLAPMDKMKK